MKIKKGAVLTGLKLEMRRVLISADVLWRENGKELVITEGTGGVHSAGSLHPYGYALDLRSRYFKGPRVAIAVIAGELRRRLGARYNVVVHKSHIHVEYDAAKFLVDNPPRTSARA